MTLTSTLFASIFALILTGPGQSTTPKDTAEPPVIVSPGTTGAPAIPQDDDAGDPDGPGDHAGGTPGAPGT